LKKIFDSGQIYSMRIRETSLSQILLGLALIAALMWNLAYGAEVRWVQMDSSAGTTRAEIGLDATAEYKVLRLSNPDRLVVDFPASRLGPRFALPPGMGVVNGVRNGQPEPGTVRIVFDLAKSVVASEPRMRNGPDGAWLVVEWPESGGSSSSSRSAATTTPAPVTAPAAAAPPAATKPATSVPPPAAARTPIPIRAVPKPKPASAPSPSSGSSPPPAAPPSAPPSTSPSSTPPATTPPQPPATPQAATPATTKQEDTLVWPVGDPAERIAIPTPRGTVPPLPPADDTSQARPQAKPSSVPQTEVSSPPPSPRNSTGPPAASELDPIAQIAAATQTGAAEQVLQVAAATPVAVSVSSHAAATPRGAAQVRRPQQSPAPPTPAAASAALTQTSQASTVSPLRPLVIAIDAGHGGRDPGAVGPGGTYEKNIVLSIARELARQIDATPGMRAHLIRNSDVYVELPQRALSAREAKADMFVSIHADAAENRSAQGASVYTLSTTGASSQHARWLADRENSADLIGGVKVENSTLSSVLLDLAHSGHMKASQDAAIHVLSGLSGVGKAHKNKVEYANFSVLRNADMPAMLVETGFISNASEEKRLRDPAYQRRLASAILNGVNAFFRNQPPPGTLFAANAAAGKAHIDAGGGGLP